jgi:hypothetical protein
MNVRMGHAACKEHCPVVRVRFTHIFIVHHVCRGTLARVAADWQPQANEEDVMRLLLLLQDVARGLTLLHAKNIVHADLVSPFNALWLHIAGLTPGVHSVGLLSLIEWWWCLHCCESLAQQYVGSSAIAAYLCNRWLWRHRLLPS